MTLDQRWNELQPANKDDVFQLLDPDHPLDFYIGRDARGGRSLLLLTTDTPPAPKEYRAIRIQTFQRPDGRWSLLFRLTSPELTQLFTWLCQDLVEAGRRVVDPARPVAVLMKRFANWQRLMASGHNGLMDENRIRGLCGELLFLEQQLLPVFGGLASVTGWVGPERAHQDFQMCDKAWEIKTIRPGSTTVRISSEHQLDSKARPIELVVVSLADLQSSSPDGFTLNRLADRLYESLAGDLEAQDLFLQRLAAYGYIRRPEYDSRYYRVTACEAYVAGDGFPALAPSGLPSFISQVTYDLDLAGCKPYLKQ
ncbi:putative PD-(D/E)XK family protein DUF4420 [Vogesella indigofera]|uniref:Putative PD-(D/E)XK family protein DUF4420 n=1 Tax=Vogesella indigofera TaxID=45465 RepID=A0A495BDS4_VOGIN|nr:PD-(D/E)XK motif protein [Vogesella indigofera]RKQ57835.1 putative PD-(D/E)XK family protein DUF4420 [Vogesella indigofera]